jgi:hypothetical protein
MLDPGRGCQSQAGAGAVLQKTGTQMRGILAQSQNQNKQRASVWEGKSESHYGWRLIENVGGGSYKFKSYSYGNHNVNVERENKWEV